MPHYHVGLFIGRFQPFHLGHLSALKQGLEVVGKTILVVGSANRNFEFKNPLTADERVEIIKTVIKTENLENKIKLLTVADDIPDNLAWADKLIKDLPPFQVVIGNNVLVNLLFEYRGFKLFTPKLTKREVFQGQIIRQKIIQGQKWQHLVPKSTLPLLEKFKFEKRLKLLDDH